MADPGNRSIEFVAPIEVHDISEAEVQRQFEKNLDKIDDSGMIHIGSFIPIGVGIIDTLAIDLDGRPVIIEYKKPGVDSREAVIQAMDYWTYCTQHFNHIKSIIDSKLTNLKNTVEIEVSDDIRIVVVASEFDERLQRSVSALSCETALLSYRVLKQGEKLLVVPHMRVGSNTAIKGPEPKPPKNLDDHFKGKEKFRPLFDKLIEALKELKVPCEINAQPQGYIALIGDKRNYSGLHVKGKWIRVDLPLTPAEAQFPGYTPWSEGGDSGYLHFDAESQIVGVASLLEKAFKKTHGL